MALQGTPASPVTPGTAVTFTATPNGGRQVEYRFMQQFNGIWSELRGWSTEKTFTWTPSASGNYAIQVRAREVGTTVTGVLKSVSYKVAPAITALTLTGDPPSPVCAYRHIALTAQATGGTTPEYRFLVKSGTTWTVISEWSATNTCTWTPMDAGSYTVQVRVREQGSTASYTLYRQVVYTVYPSPKLGY